MKKNEWEKKFIVTTEDMDHKSTIKEHMTADYVIVSNGNYSLPLIPRLPGADTYTGNTLHSHNVRYFKDLAPTTSGKRVLVVGGRPSGLDIVFGLLGSKEACPSAIYSTDIGRTLKLLKHLKNKKVLPETVEVMNGPLIRFTGEKTAAFAGG